MSRLRRILRYLICMFPPWVMVPVGFAHFFTIHFAIQAMAGQMPLRLDAVALAGAVTVVGLLLLLRVYDELKDFEVDRRLAREGDPAYRDRPIVTGEVTTADLNWLRWGVTVGIVVVNLPLGVPLPLMVFTVVLLVLWLSFRWFFCPAISRSLLLAFVTHNPLSLVISGYVVAVTVSRYGLRMVDLRTLPLLIGLWMATAAWETSRKIRIPEEETAYQTYSKVLGWKIAALLPAFFCTASLACLLPIAHEAGLGRVYLVLLGIVGGVLIFSCLLFRLYPTPWRANLRPWAELYGAVATVGFAVAICVSHGTIFEP